MPNSDIKLTSPKGLAAKEKMLCYKSDGAPGSPKALCFGPHLARHKIHHCYELIRLFLLKGCVDLKPVSQTAGV